MLAPDSSARRISRLPRALSRPIDGESVSLDERHGGVRRSFAHRSFAAAGLVSALLASVACGHGGGDPKSSIAPTAVTSPADAGAGPVSTRFSVAGPEASPITFERIARFPEPGWHVPRSIQHAPDGSRITFLASENGTEEMALFALETSGASPTVLLRARDLAPSNQPMSRDEELRRERQRQRTEGITSYRWARKASVMVVPHGGDVFVADGHGKVEQLTRTPAPEVDAQICDTGERVAFVRNGELVVIDVVTKRETIVTRGAPEGVTRGLADFNAQEEFGQSSGFFWSPNCDRIAYVEVDERSVTQVPILGWRGGRDDLMMQRYPLAGTANPKVRLGIVDVRRAGTQTTASPTRWVIWPAPETERYLTNVVWSDDDKTLWLESTSRNQQTRAIVRIDGADARARAQEIARESSRAWIDPSPLELLPKSKELVVTSDRTGHRHLEVIRQDTGARLRTLTEGPWDVTSIVAVDEDRGRILFTSTQASPLERHLYELPLAGGTPIRKTREHGIHDIRPSEHGRNWVDVHSAIDRLPRAELFVEGQARSELPVHRDEDIDTLGLRSPELVTIRAGDGTELHGALLAPRRVLPGRAHPAIVMVYGGPGSQTVVDQWSPRLMWQHLADRGFFVFQLDNRGTEGRGLAFEHATYRQLGKVELADQLAGAAWLAKVPGVDPKRLGIYGHSFGGFMTSLAMLRAPDTFAVGVAGSPVTDWRLYDTAYTERFMDTPASNPEGYDAADLSKLAGNLRGRLMIVHANMDENVHYTNTARLVDAFVAANKPFDLFVFPGERHGYRGKAARPYAMEHVARYFAEHL